jgi:LuxR family maltose regulon positive regulatory protein
LAESTARRLWPQLGLQGHLAWLEGRAQEAAALWQRALEDEEACDLYGLAHELRTRLAQLRWRARDPAAAAAWLAPMLAQAADGPRGALFALPALRELASASWDHRLDEAAQATLRAWADAASAAPAGFAPAPTPSKPLRELLSARETEVLALMARGMSNKLIARELDLSPHTVKRHVANLLDKLDLESRGQAALWYQAQTGA